MAADGEIGRVWSLRRSRVFYAIDVLTRLGFARASRTVASRSSAAIRFVNTILTQGSPPAR